MSACGIFSALEWGDDGWAWKRGIEAVWPCRSRRVQRAPCLCGCAMEMEGCAATGRGCHFSSSVTDLSLYIQLTSRELGLLQSPHAGPIALADELWPLAQSGGDLQGLFFSPTLVNCEDARALE